MIKIEFPASDKRAAAAFSLALAQIAGDTLLSELGAQAPAEPGGPGAPSRPENGELNTGGQEQEQEQEQQTASPTPTPTPTPSASEEPGRVDHKQVVFDPAFCADAKEPFYSSGARSGQWKKRRGVSDADYDKWYAAVVALQVDDGKPEEPEQEEVNTAAAFGGDQTAAPTAPAAPAEQAPGVTNTGELIGWISEQQSVGNLTQADVDATYKSLGITVTDLFAPTPAETIAQNLQNVYADLMAKVAG